MVTKVYVCVSICVCVFSFPESVFMCFFSLERDDRKGII